MKKLISVFLAALMLLSVFSVAASADFELPPDAYTVVFALQDDNGDPISPYLSTGVYYEGTSISTVAQLNEPDSYKGEDGLTYYFIGWRNVDGETVRTSNKLPKVAGDAIYVAVYEAQDLSEGQTLLQFFKSIFERMNTIFEYFWNIFFRERG